ncbi:MAG TPA: M14 family zinc carboxypeptidase [Xanthomonadales bacterium]|nr:M14 family zinc carboxypeptidase [Xanthomonadales bacterium]
MVTGARNALALALVLAAAPAGAQVLQTYTQSAGGANTRPLGYPVPLPIASLTPVDGFRDYASLHARHQQLALESDDVAGTVVGTTQQYGRDIWAYTLGDADAVTVDGRPEGAAIVNAATHAREWQAPEVSTGIIEHLALNANDAGVVRYVLDNFHVVVVPVHNVDGFLQTQAFPAQVVVGQDPTNPVDWPRDGRMRRKNMRGVDETITTLADHLGGVDLNRNHPPYWGPASSGGSRGVPNPNALTYHGAAIHSEAENRAFLAAIELARPQRLRLGQDIHSFSSVFFSSNTGSAPLNRIQSNLLRAMQGHHAAVSTSARFPSGRFYAEVRDPVNAGIGAAAEYLADRFLVPAWTLELEPANGGTEYGGSGESHSGFILPAAEIARVRSAWATTQLLAFYLQAGHAYVAETVVTDVASGAVVHRSGWTGASGERVRRVESDGPLVAGRRYALTLIFSKPMRVRTTGTPTAFVGVASVPDLPAVSLRNGATVTAAAGGAWRAEPGAYRRYRDDTYTTTLDVPAQASGTAALAVAVQDLGGNRLDANPRTAVDWQAGAWTNLEDETGVAGELGGEDRTLELPIATATPATIRARLVGADRTGNRAQRLVIERLDAGPAVTVRIDVVAPGLAPPATLSASEVRWDDGQRGARSVIVRYAPGVTLADDAAWVQLRVVAGSARLPQAALGL